MARTQPYFQALPAFFGGKRRLVPLLFALLAEVLAPAAWTTATLIDAMVGGGAVALHAKALGFHVVASDAALRSVVVARALIANSRVRLSRADILRILAAATSDGPAGAFVPGVFTAGQAALLNGLLAVAAGLGEPHESLVQLLAVKFALRSQPMSQLRGTDARAAAGGDYDRVSPRRLRHYINARRWETPAGLWALAQEINLGVFGGSGVAEQGDARAVLARTPADVAVLDPPYPGTARYQDEYAVLDALLGDSPDLADLTLDGLLEAAAHIPVIVLTYGGPHVALEDVTAAVARHRRVVRAVSVPYPHLASLASAQRRAADREYLVVAVR